MKNTLSQILLRTTKAILLLVLLVPFSGFAAKFSTKASQVKSSLTSRSFIESSVELKVSKEFQQSFWQQIYGNSAPSDIDFGVNRFS